MDRLLERAVKARRGEAPRDGCLDAETLAAWADGSLEAWAREAAEAHAADCDRCLPLLATMIRTTPPAAEAQPRSRWFFLRWVVPLTAATAAAIVWVAVDRSPSSPPTPPVSQIARADQPLPAEPSVATPSSGARERRVLPAPSASELQRPTPRPGAQTDTAQAPAARDADRTAQGAGNVAGFVPPPGDQRMDRAEEKAASSAASAAPQPAPPAAPPPARPESASPFADANRQPERPRAMTETVGIATARQGPVSPIEIGTPDPQVRWRLAAGVVQRSIDAGRSWQAQSTGSTAVLLAGSAPARDVCWLVGRAGTILLTTDGHTWRRIAGPVDTELTAVTASDASTASVTTAAGRTYRTRDSGRTWTLQEDPATPF
jgi:hypothetical protein